MVHALLSPKLLLWLHIAEIVLILAVIIITVVRLTMGVSMSGGGRMGLAFGAKSLVFISYELLTEHVRALQRWRSLKANAIINGIEIVFWAAVVYLVMAANMKGVCAGTVCALGWVEVVLAIFVTLLCKWVFVISYLEFRAYRANGNRYPEECALPKTMHDMSSTSMNTTAPGYLDPRHPMMASREPSPVRSTPGAYGVVHDHEEYHSGYARTPTSVV